MRKFIRTAHIYCPISRWFCLEDKGKQMGAIPLPCNGLALISVKPKRWFFLPNMLPSRLRMQCQRACREYSHLSDKYRQKKHSLVMMKHDMVWYWGLYKLKVYKNLEQGRKIKWQAHRSMSILRHSYPMLLIPLQAQQRRRLGMGKSI